MDTSIETTIRSAFPDPRADLVDLFSVGDRAAGCLTISGMHRGKLMAIPASGKTIFLHAITVLRFENGKCVERWSEMDTMGLLIQLGAGTAPAA